MLIFLSGTCWYASWLGKCGNGNFVSCYHNNAMVIGRDVPTKSFSVLSYSSSIFSDVNIFILISPLYSQESEFLLKSKSFLMFFFSLMLCRVMILNLNFSLVLTTWIIIKENLYYWLESKAASSLKWPGIFFDNCNASCHF